MKSEPRENEMEQERLQGSVIVYGEKVQVRALAGKCTSLIAFTVKPLNILASMKYIPVARGVLSCANH